MWALGGGGTLSTPLHLRLYPQPDPTFHKIMEGRQYSHQHFPEEKFLSFAGHRVTIPCSSMSLVRAGSKGGSA